MKCVCVCVYVYVYICMYVYMYMYIYTLPRCVCVYVCVCVCVCVLPRCSQGSNLTSYVGTNSQCQRCKRLRFDPWVGKIPWRRKWQSAPVFLLGEENWTLTEEPGGLQSIALQRVGHYWSDWACMHIYAYIYMYIISNELLFEARFNSSLSRSLPVK